MAHEWVGKRVGVRIRTDEILIAPTEFSATAPLKVAARSLPIRAATMPGFRADMIPALRLDYGEVNRRVGILKALLDHATGADIVFAHPKEMRIDPEVEAQIKANVEANGGSYSVDDNMEDPC